MFIRKVVIVAMAFLLMGCSKSKEVLTIAVIPAEGELATEDKFAPTIAYLEESLDLKVELVTVSSYAAVVEAMKYGHADIARFGPFSYVLATREADVEAVVMGVKEKTGRASYKGYIISRPDLESLDGATFAFVDEGSTSGHLVPSVYLKDIDLGKTMFAGSHPAVIEAVKNGSVDAGAVADNRWFYALENDVISEGDLKIFWESGDIPASPWAVRSDLKEDLKSAFAAAMMSMPEDAVIAQGIGDIRFVVATDSDYDFVREVQKAQE